MPDYYITKHITLRKKNPFGSLINSLILIIAIPVIAISVISLLLYFFFMWILSFDKNKTMESSDEHYSYEMELLHNDYVKIILTEDELDTELSGLNEMWMENVYNRETCLYRARTIPQIEELEGKILCFYIKEKPEGAILQVLNKTGSDSNPLNSELVFLYYHNLKVVAIDNAGDYYLHNDPKNANLIMGFNKKEKIRMEIIKA